MYMSGTLIKVEDEFVPIKRLENLILLRTANEIYKFVRTNEIKLRGQQRKDGKIKLLKKYQLINVIEDKVYAVAVTGVLPGELKTAPEIRKYARDRGLPVTNKMKKENIKNLLIKIGYAEKRTENFIKNKGLIGAF